jgi:ABC-type multidrug transport system ATPase subunit/preprotein translocase subunit SecF
VPASLLTALALLFIGGQSINLITLFGLAVGIGMLVDNSIVVYEAVQRQLERGAGPDRAAEYGVRRTVRAILAATLTTAIVFLPLAFADFDDGLLRAMLVIMALAILLPLLGSVFVAVGLVPLLARRLAAPAAIARLAARRRRREKLGGLTPPDRAQEMFSGLLVVALRRPTAWVTVIIVAVLLTVVIALPWVTVGTATQEPPEAQQVRFEIDIDAGHSLERTTGVFERLETAVMSLEGLKLVESMIREEGGTLTVHLLPKEERPDDVHARRVRHIIHEEEKGLQGVEIDSQSQGFGGGGGGGQGRGGGVEALFGQAAATAVLSGSDAQVLNKIAHEIQAQLQSIPEVGQTSIEGRTGQHEIRVIPAMMALQAYGLTADQVLPALSVVRREGIAMRTGFTLHDGREIPMTVRREEDERPATEDLRDLRLATPAGVLPLSAVANVRKMPPPPTILHHNGRREIGISYRLGDQAPKTGPARQALDEQIEAAIQQVHRPPGYTIETPDPDASFSWFKKIIAPVVLLLFAVLALTFESLTLPLLVLLALPLTVLGATWALVLADMPADYMALVGALALIGLTVNPAILLVDRMQHRAWQGGMSAGAAALAAVRERARPVLMTATTTVAGLWPLALVTGRDNEIWPPFATIVMGGLVTSTLLTLLVVPVGFVFLHRLDRLFGRLGPWVMIGWVGATTVVMTPMIVTDTISSMRWRIVTTLLVAAALLGVAVLIFRRPQLPKPEMEDGPPAVDVRYLHKVYGRPGPVGRAWRVQQRFAEAVRKFGGRAFHPRDALGRLLPIGLVLAGVSYLAYSSRSVPWRMVFLFAAAALVAALFKQLRAARGCADATGRVDLGGPENVVAALAPWAVMAYISLRFRLLAWVTNLQMNEASESFFEPEPYDIRVWVLIVVAVVLLVAQLGRRTAVHIARGRLPLRPSPDIGLWHGVNRWKVALWIAAWMTAARVTRFAVVAAEPDPPMWLNIVSMAGVTLALVGLTLLFLTRRWRSLWRRFSRFCFGLDLPREEVRALAGVHFRAERGMVGILGPNGAGKTTLLRMLAGILDPSLGNVSIGSVPVKKLRRFLARWVGYLPQDFGLPKDLTAREYVDYYALLYEIRPTEVRRERVDRLLKEVGLGERADEKIGSFSGGMLQRVAVARTLLRLPPVIVVDEPTVGLDPRERIRFRNLLSRLAEGRVVLFSTHVVEDVEVACERVIVLARGRIVFDGDPPDLAAAAEGKVWVATWDKASETELPKEALLVDQVPEGDDSVRSRILAVDRPTPGAEPVPPTLQDGYLWLVGERNAA